MRCLIFGLDAGNSSLKSLNLEAVPGHAFLILIQDGLAFRSVGSFKQETFVSLRLLVLTDATRLYWSFLSFCGLVVHWKVLVLFIR